MASIRKKGKKEVPAVSTSSLPDIIYMLLFFFMVSTTMKEVTYMVDVHVPQATELQKLENKSVVRYVYIGSPMRQYQNQYGKETRIQLDDAFADVKDIEEYIVRERSAMKEDEQNLLTVSIKADQESNMGIVTDIKQALRRAYALKISYAATQRTDY